MTQAVLATSHAIRFAVTYLIFQAALIVFSISSAFRIMTYHVTFHDVDLSKMITVSELWSLVLYNRNEMQQYNYMGSDITSPTPVANLVPGEMPHGGRRLFQEEYTQQQSKNEELREILQSYVTRETPAIHMYSGMFDSRFVLHREIEKLLHETVQESFPFQIQIDSLDSVVMLYSLSLTFIGFLFYNLHQKSQSKELSGSNIDMHEVTGDFMLFDVLFWLNLTILIFLVFDISTMISVPIITVWISFVYTVLLYVLCQPNSMKRHSQFCVMFAWSLHVLFFTSLAHAAVGDGGFVLMGHLLLLVFTYISTTEGMTEVKFLNLRIWCCVFMNMVFLCIYFSNVEIIPPDTSR